ncbi:12927_t:CDS:2, partial [Gigaspora margarita]
MNNEQFQQFIKLMTKAVSKDEPKLSKHEEVQQQVGSELKDLKKRIEGLALNYANLSAQLKDTKKRRYRMLESGKIGHTVKNCISEKGKYPYNNQRKEKGNFNPTKNISFCELEDTNNEEIYTVNNITSINATKRLANSKWEDRLQKVARVPQGKEIEEPNTNDPIMIQNLLPLKNPKLAEVPISNSGIESLTPYKNVDVYSEGGDTFDEFDYEEEELEDLEEENIN